MGIKMNIWEDFHYTGRKKSSFEPPPPIWKNISVSIIQITEFFVECNILLRMIQSKASGL